jgi:hypothetical protein
VAASTRHFPTLERYIVVESAIVGRRRTAGGTRLTTRGALGSRLARLAGA